MRYSISDKVEHNCCYDCTVVDNNVKDYAGNPQRILETWSEYAHLICDALNNLDGEAAEL